VSAVAMLKNSELLRGKVDLCVPALEGVFAALWRHPDVRTLTLSFLVLLHQIMRASVPLMQSAQERCEQLDSSDDVAKALRRYYCQHIQEELNHDVWLLEDLSSAGLNPGKTASITPSVAVARLVGAQYYWIHHHHPLMLLGYIMVLEAFPPSTGQVDMIRTISGLPEDAFRTLRIHGALDPTHSVEIDETIDALPLNRHQLEMLSLSILHTCDALASSVKALRPVNQANSYLGTT
jgi:hypothetical protein